MDILSRERRIGLRPIEGEAMSKFQRSISMTEGKNSGVELQEETYKP